jgi:hypothetical protein
VACATFLLARCGGRRRRIPAGASTPRRSAVAGQRRGEQWTAPLRHATMLARDVRASEGQYGDRLHPAGGLPSSVAAGGDVPFTSVNSAGQMVSDAPAAAVQPTPADVSSAVAKLEAAPPAAAATEPSGRPRGRPKKSDPTPGIVAPFVAGPILTPQPQPLFAQGNGATTEKIIQVPGASSSELDALLASVMK